MEKLHTCDVDMWQIKGCSKNKIGLYAEDVYEKFGLNTGNTIGTQDNDGILLSALKGLYLKHLKLLERIEKLESLIK